MTLATDGAGDPVRALLKVFQPDPIARQLRAFAPGAGVAGLVPANLADLALAGFCHGVADLAQAEDDAGAFPMIEECGFPGLQLAHARLLDNDDFLAPTGYEMDLVTFLHPLNIRPWLLSEKYYHLSGDLARL